MQTSAKPKTELIRRYLTQSARLSIFAVIVTFSEKEGEVDELLRMYEQWTEKQVHP